MEKNQLGVVPNQIELVNRPTTISVSILDESGSMRKFGATPPEAINGHHQSLRESTDGRQYLCAVITFSATHEVRIPLMPVEDIGPLKGYDPCGSTLLWKTVYLTLESLIDYYKRYKASIPREFRNELKVVVGVFSDGKDTASPVLTQPQALQIIAAKALELGWKLQTFGIGIDAGYLARRMGFPDDDEHTLTVEATPQGIQDSVIEMTRTTMGQDVRPRKAD